ncbi:MAG: flagella basal body P-ring formation protein FlgA [Fimbriimonadales bacterium]|nr:flagella basal body P-ring formation protein FlgA [Fimbriimonadales bacterium]
MRAVLMFGLLWMVSARLMEEQRFGSTGSLIPAEVVRLRRVDNPVYVGSAEITARVGLYLPDSRLDKTAQATIRIPAEATVNAPRFRLGDIATIETEDSTVREQLAQIELGASPLAGQTRTFTKQQLLTRLRQHKIELGAIRIEMPDTVRLTRTAQILDASQLEQFARAQLRAVVGESASEWTLETPPAPVSLPSGAVEFRLEGAPRVASGSATMEITALVEGQPRTKYLLRFKAPQKARQIAVRSGEGVQVRVLSGGVVLEVRGVARATGAVDEIIPIYIPDTQKTIRAQIVESGVVEVRL